MDDNMANREMPGRSNGYYRRLTQFTAKNRRNVKNTMICSVQKEGSAVYQILSDMNMDEYGIYVSSRNTVIIDSYLQYRYTCCTSL